jgi:threonylcarbamoyladenosine tRNA methylthiotransferase MtaB
MMSHHASIVFVPQTPLNITQRGQELSTSPVSSALQAVTRRPTFALYTLGCKVNQYDSHQISRSLVQRGFRRVEFRESADLYVIDTCTVTAEADKKSRKAAGRAHRNNAEAVVAITGCAAAYARDQFQRVVPDALVLDNTRKLELPELAIAALQARPDWNNEYSKLRDEIGSEPLPSATRERAVLKVQDGCNHKCSYCIIPTVRGASVTKTRETIMSEARAFVREGARELTVTGVSMSDWGAAQNRENHHSRNAALCDLLRSVAKIEGLERVRVSSLDPADVDDEFLHTVANTPKVCPHIHLALQAGSAATLRRMRRRYTPEMFLRAAKRWREIRPDGGLTTDVIVGFPGETAADFEQSLHIAREAKFSAVHVFPYSPRAGTVAAGLPDHVAPAEQKRRVDALLQLARELSAEYAAQFLGQTLPVLVESTGHDAIEGMTPHYVKARVQLESSTQQIAPGDIVWMCAAKWSDDTLHGTWQPRLGRE